MSIKRKLQASFGVSDTAQIRLEGVHFKDFSSQNGHQRQF